MTGNLCSSRESNAFEWVYRDDPDLDRDYMPASWKASCEWLGWGELVYLQYIIFFRTMLWEIPILKLKPEETILLGTFVKMAICISGDEKKLSSFPRNQKLLDIIE